MNFYYRKVLVWKLTSVIMWFGASEDEMALKLGSAGRGVQRTPSSLSRLHMHLHRAEAGGKGTLRKEGACVCAFVLLWQNTSIWQFS